MPPRRSFGHALKWAMVMNSGTRGIATAVTFLLAALLGPADFGLVAVALIYIAFVRMLLEQGFITAIIQREQLDPEHLDSAFWLNVAWCLILACVSFLTAGWWADVNNMPRARGRNPRALDPDRRRGPRHRPARADGAAARLQAARAPLQSLGAARRGGRRSARAGRRGRVGARGATARARDDAARDDVAAEPLAARSPLLTVACARADRLLGQRLRRQPRRLRQPPCGRAADGHLLGSRGGRPLPARGPARRRAAGGDDASGGARLAADPLPPSGRPGEAARSGREVPADDAADRRPRPARRARGQRRDRRRARHRLGTGRNRPPVPLPGRDREGDLVLHRAGPVRGKPASLPRDHALGARGCQHRCRGGRRRAHSRLVRRRPGAGDVLVASCSLPLRPRAREPRNRVAHDGPATPDAAAGGARSRALWSRCDCSRRRAARSRRRGAAPLAGAGRRRRRGRRDRRGGAARARARPPRTPACPDPVDSRPPVRADPGRGAARPHRAGGSIGRAVRPDSRGRDAPLGGLGGLAGCAVQALAPPLLERLREAATVGDPLRPPDARQQHGSRQVDPDAPERRRVDEDVPLEPARGAESALVLGVADSVVEDASVVALAEVVDQVQEQVGADAQAGERGVVAGAPEPEATLIQLAVVKCRRLAVEVQDIASEPAVLHAHAGPFAVCGRVAERDAERPLVGPGRRSSRRRGRSRRDRRAL